MARRASTGERMNGAMSATWALEALLRAADRLSRASRHGRGWEW